MDICEPRAVRPKSSKSQNRTGLEYYRFVQNVDIAVHTYLYLLEIEESVFSPTSLGLTWHTLPVVEMAQSSNVIVNGGTFNSAQGDLHIHSRDSESGMHDFSSVHISILIDDPMKDFIS